jgi:outer membrane lipoprotein-sorting protein
VRRFALLPARRLWAVAAAVCVLALGAGIAQAALSGGARPPARPLATAVHDALTATPVAGVTARIAFTNRLVPAGTAGRDQTSPLVSGATGRLWLARDGRIRLELQSQAGDAQILSDGTHLTVYDPASHTAYRVALPAGRRSHHQGRAPSLADVRTGLERLARGWTLSGARPTSTAGRPSYTVRLSPRDRGGLLGAAELAWDAARGVPLRAAVYARGESSPVLELAATHISYGPVPASDLDVRPPADAKVVDLQPPTAAAAPRGRLSFRVVAPARLAGLPRLGVHRVGADAALVAYGHGLGTVVVLERPAGAAAGGNGRGPMLPEVDVGGAKGRVLATPLGTVIAFERAGVSYVVAGPVGAATAEGAARGLR